MKNFWQKLEKPILCLAPMAGITDSAFRQVCKSFGADVVYTEMISADGLFYDSKKTLAMLKFEKSEKPVVLQLFGKRPETFIKAAKMGEQAGFDGIDINFGCPARKVVAHGGGVTLMRDLGRCREIVAAVCQATKLPVSVKIRSGIGTIGRIGPIGRIRDKKITALDFIKAIKDLPVAAVMIHGRSYEQGFIGSIDYEMIKEVKEFLNSSSGLSMSPRIHADGNADLRGNCLGIKNRLRPVVIANGGINTPEEAAVMLKKTQADGLGLARGVLGKPWLFRQIRDYLATGKYQELSWPEIKAVILKQADLACRLKGEWGVVEMRKHLAWYVKGWPGARELRVKLVRVKKVSEIAEILAEEK